MNDVDFASVQATIKQALKRKRMTYSALAERLGMSESGVKKMLSASDCSMGRLLEICSALEISFADVVEASRRRDLEVVRLTPDQMRFFEGHPDHYRFYRELQRDGFDLDAFRARIPLDEASIQGYLLKLDRHDLVTLMPGGRLKRAARSAPGVQPISAKLADQVSRAQHHRLLDSAWSLITEGSEVYTADQRRRISGAFMGALRLTEASAAELKEALQALADSYFLRSRWEAAACDPAELVELALLTAMSPFDVTYTIPPLRAGGQPSAATAATSASLRAKS